ncbi:MAG TPA: M14 metallopeptidase family protein [Bryobacteraceae bacterium]
MKNTILGFTFFCVTAAAQHITTPTEALGFNVGDDYQMASYTQLESWWKKLASESSRMKLVDIGATAEGRRQYMAIITSPENHKKLEHYRDIARRLALAEGLSDDAAHQLASEGKAVVWIDGGLHATETVGSQQLMEWVYEMVGRSDAETQRFLNDVILLCVPNNPDGQEMVAKWYMRNADPKKRTFAGLPRLYEKYAGHDDNRDFYMSNLPETENTNRILYRQWFPQIMYNHHQTGPRGAVVFIPPFRDPFNYNYDPLIVMQIEQLGTAMHSRLLAEGKYGSGMRSVSTYSTWYNGGLRTTTYFHNMIGLLTEIIGSPTPTRIPLLPERQLPIGDLPAPIAPQEWHYRQSIEYEMTQNRAVMDYASKYRETLLYNIYRMGKNSIERGSTDSWTTTPKRIEMLRAAAKGKEVEDEGAGGAENFAGDAPRAVSAELYKTVLHKPELRDPRGYILSADQPDFATATKFVNVLIKNGIAVERAKSAFMVAGKNYPMGSYVVKTAQAFRPHVLDMFEPQDHPNDFRYPGGPPVAPYDSTGYTLAFLMNVQFDRILDGFDGPFEKLTEEVKPRAGKITGPTNPSGYLLSHRVNDSFILVNRLLKLGCEVYWLKSSIAVGGKDAETGAVWVPSTSAAKAVIEKGARELGVDAYAVAQRPSGDALKLKPVRIGLADQYGGSMPSGWVRYIFEHFEFPYEVVFPKTLDDGNLSSHYDVLVFMDGAIRAPAGMRRGGGGGQPRAESIPEEDRAMLGRITTEKTIPQIRKFIEGGGDVVTVGGSTGLAELMGLPLKSALTERAADGSEHTLPRDKFYVPGSVLRAAVDANSPLAYGYSGFVDVFFDNDPVFKLLPDAQAKGISSVAWFAGPAPLRSGWAWGQQYLDGGVAVAEAKVGEGKLFLLGPEVTFRAQPHGTYKFLFNGIYYGTAKPMRLD